MTYLEFRQQVLDPLSGSFCAAKYEKSKENK